MPIIFPEEATLLSLGLLTMGHVIGWMVLPALQKICLCSICWSLSMELYFEYNLNVIKSKTFVRDHPGVPR